MPRRLVALILTALAIATFGVVEPARACSCAGFADAYDQLSHTEVMFRGTAVGSTPLAPSSASGAAGETRGVPEVATTFTIAKVFKGAPATTLVIVHPANVCCVCGLTFKPGRDYIVFASTWRGRLHASACGQHLFDPDAYERALARLEREGKITRAPAP